MGMDGNVAMLADAQRWQQVRRQKAFGNVPNKAGHSLVGPHGPQVEVPHNLDDLLPLLLSPFHCSFSEPFEEQHMAPAPL